MSFSKQVRALTCDILIAPPVEPVDREDTLQVVHLSEQSHSCPPLAAELPRPQGTVSFVVCHFAWSDMNPSTV